MLRTDWENLERGDEVTLMNRDIVVCSKTHDHSFRIIGKQYSIRYEDCLGFTQYSEDELTDKFLDAFQED